LVPLFDSRQIEQENDEDEKLREIACELKLARVSASFREEVDETDEV